MKPYKHQQDIIDLDPKYYLLGLGTGTGKTFTALSLAKGKTLVVCPKTLKLDETFERQLKKMGKDLPLTVISKERFRIDYPRVPECDTLIIDESHTATGIQSATRWVGGKQYPKTSQLFTKLHDYIKKVNPSRVYLLSATPAPKPLNVLGHGLLLGKKWSYYEFRDAFYYQNTHIGRGVYLPRKGDDVQDVLIKKLHGLGSFVTLQDCFDVPEQTFITETIELTAEQKKELKEAKILYPEPLIYRTKAYGIENGIHYTHELETLNEKELRIIKKTDLIKDNKMVRILELAEEFPKVVVFAMFKAQVSKIAEELKARGKKVFVLTGETKDRKGVLEGAEKATNCVFIAQAGVSAGYELKSFRTVVFASLSNKYIDYIQAQGRVLRVDNLQKNLYVHLVTRDGADRQAYDTIKKGEDFQLKLTAK